MDRPLRTASSLAAALIGLAAMSAWGEPAPAVETKPDSSATPPIGTTGSQGAAADSSPAATADGDKPKAKPAVAEKKTSASMGMAKFVIPKPPAEGATAAAQLPQRLTYQYAWGTQSDVVYRRDPDLNRRVRDDTFIITPQLNGYITYRPTDWLETTVEMIFDREIAAVEEPVVNLPNGEMLVAAPREFSIRVDQAFVGLRAPGDRIRFTAGRRNYEDERHWLFDTALDTAGLGFKLGKFRVEALAGREILVDLDLIGPGEGAVHQIGAKRKKDLINTYALMVDYRGVEDIKLGVQAILRDDRARVEGRPLLISLQSQGTPSQSFNYWAQLAMVRGKDEAWQPLSGYAFDVGATYRFTALPLHPNLTLGYAFGSGDDNPKDGTNHEFRQTGLQSNESRFAGLAKFKVYGEVLDPELINLQILTAAVGFWPAPGFSVDVVYHRYLLNAVAGDVKNAEVTAQMNEVPGQSSKDVGSAIDVVLGFRNLFGLRRLGLDLRVGWFFPGKAFAVNDGTSENPSFRSPNNGFKTFAKFWW
jgi:alginate production protein